MLSALPAGLWIVSLSCDLLYLGGAEADLWAPLALYTMVGGFVVALVAHVAIDAQRVRPVALDRDAREAVVLDQPARQLRAEVIELVRAVRGFAEQYDVRVGEQIEQLIDLVVAVDRACYPRHRLREFTYGNRHHDQTCRRQTWCQMSGYVATKFFQRVR